MQFAVPGVTSNPCSIPSGIPNVGQIAGIVAGDFSLINSSFEPWLNIKMSSYQYRKSHCGDKVMQSPQKDFYTGKMVLYWISPWLQIVEIHS